MKEKKQEKSKENQLDECLFIEISYIRNVTRTREEEKKTYIHERTGAEYHLLMSLIHCCCRRCRRRRYVGINLTDRQIKKYINPEAKKKK